MFENLFAQSIQPKKVNFLNNFARRKLSGTSFVDEVNNIEHYFEFYNDDIKTSKKLHEFHFTNFLNDNTSHEILSRIKDLAKNPSIIDNQMAGTVNLNDRIKNCVGLYYDIENEETEVIFKSELSGINNTQIGVRVFAIADIESDDENFRSVFKIILIDPFHLIIPSAHKRQPKDKVKKNTYFENVNNKTCMIKYFDEVLLEQKVKLPSPQ